MKSVSILNRAASRRLLPSALFVLGVVLGMGALWAQLAAIYTRPTPLPAAPARLPAGLPEEAVTVPAEAGFQSISLRQGLLLVRGPDRPIGQQDLALCDQSVDSAAGPVMAPLYVGWDWPRLREAAAANRAARPSRPMDGGLKNSLLDDGPDGVDVPAFAVTAEPAGGPPRPYADAGSLRVTLYDRRPVLLLADTAETGTGPALAFRRDLWLLWNAGPVVAGHWDRALRIRLLEDRVCPLGRLRIEVYGPSPENAGMVDAEPRTVLWYAGDGSAREFRLAPGHYAPAAPSPPREDAELFERSLAAGLLRSGEDGRIAIAPADLSLRRAFARFHPDLLASGDDEHDWLDGPWSAETQRLHQALRFSVTGRYVRRQVATFNARQLLAAVRWRPENADPSGDWRADWKEVPLVLTGSMPLLAERLFTEAPHGWQAWRRVARWPALEQRWPVRFRLSLPRPARSGERLELLVVGGPPAVSGAAVLASAPRCVDARPCAERDALARWLRLEMRAGATELELVFQPLPAEVFPGLYRYDFAHIRRVDGRLRWYDSPGANGGDPSRPSPAEVTLRDREGTLLWEAGQPTGAVWELGLAALVGLGPVHAGSVGGVLARLGRHGATVVEARLTVDSRLQQAARRALLERLPAISTTASETDARQEERVASLIVLDADRGDILAVAGSPEPPVGIVWSDLSTFVAAVRPRRNPLWVRAWQRDGDGLDSAGSAFELVDALLLEREAGHRPQLAAALAGLSAGELAGWPPALAYGFAADAACYPVHAGGLEPSALCDEPGGGQTLLERMRRHGDQRYGLVQALRDSARGWFAWLVESTDATLDDAGSSCLASARALTPAALRGVRPLLDIMAELDFDSAQDLDGGLLPAGLIAANDVLRASAAALEPMSDRGRVRRAALGQGVYVTPLQLAELAAAIATGQRMPPRVLAELNGQPVRDPAATALGIATDRIRRGMRLALNEEPLRTAFAGLRFDTIRASLYLKAGAAWLDATKAAANAWLVGWLEPGALPGENRRLAFACWISPATGPDGTECGELTAAWLTALAGAKSDE
ncbi:MAG: hypothetical protein IPM89_02660 [Candidatus Competibacteraceae bacterium]|nr:MAG: hypothetical protein IPM89_02660 [Candidatus Competibacteraceae bacterium]